ncbi:tyrosine-type recombinase/integrase [Herbaspirillum aquaticum]|uniref:Integrase n=1 Tax=Herbaspirillum aquaticum TaxID=568783 RepID=A0A225SLI5_9BURK|nr:site-specific integrase [Herbaspirillum aquaticum]OWY31716.1 hypothetical protein CEJ45_24305 [Herbaspirillum aquaticum]
MASISKRVRKNGSIGWQVQIRIEGRVSISKTFDHEDEAKAFCALAEEKAAILNGKNPHSRNNIFYQTKFRDVIANFLASPENKGQHKNEINSIIKFIGDATIADITQGFIAKYVKNMARSINKQGKFYSSSTIHKHLNALSRIYKWHAADYEIVPSSNLFSRKNFPKKGAKRNRRLSESEYQLIVTALATGRKRDAEHLRLLLDLALATGARLNEMILAESHEFDLENFLWCIPEEHTKSKTLRNVPLSDEACRVVQRLNQLRPTTSSRLFFCLKDSVTVSMRFFFLFKRLKIVNLRFHDLRHEAISRMVLQRRNISVFEIMEIVGHKSIEMLRRYANLRPEEVVRRFRN